MTALAEKRMTWQEFRNLEVADNDLSIYELINGLLMKRSAPSLRHQNAVSALLSKMRAFADKKKLGKVFTAPVDVLLDNGNCFQPDICFVSNERAFLLDNGEYINGAPDLVVEVLSPGTWKNDRSSKKDVYEKYAVKEYWILDPVYQTVEIFVHENNTFRLHALAEAEGRLASVVLPGFEVSVEGIYA